MPRSCEITHLGELDAAQGERLSYQLRFLDIHPGSPFRDRINTFESMAVPARHESNLYFRRSK